ncbi:MAG: PQQ-binding-like beta-propeller repeat protein [Gemmataceae bacterium]|nr:PQQ-binding-like beta-propeller repeat protein [Gemmataceae bacterium]
MMKTHSRFKRWLSAGITLGVFGVIVAVLALSGGSAEGDKVLAEQAKSDATRVWAMFGGTPNRNMVNLIDKNIPSEWDPKEKTNIKWSSALGSRAYGGPTIAGGKIFVGTNNENPRDPKVKGDKGILMCFRESDGEFLWQMVHDKLPSGQVHDWPKEGICATPAVDGNRVYYTSNRCEVVCLDVEPKKGTKEANVIWSLDMMKDLNVFPHNMTSCSPVIIGDLVFIITANGVDEEHINIPSPEAPSFIAVNKKDGKVVWKDNSPGKMIMHGQWASPAYAEVNGKGQIIFPGGDGWLRAFEPTTGKPIWKFDCNPKGSKYALGGQGTRNDFIASPVIIGDRCYIGVGQDPEHFEGIGHLWCIDLTKTDDTSPDLVTDPKSDPPKTKPNPNSAAIWHFGGPVKKEDAAKIGRDYYFGRTMSTMAIHDGLIYAGELAGFLHCLDAKTGKELWNHDLKAAVWGSAYWVDGKVMIGTEDGDVWIFEHGREKKAPKKIEMDQHIRGTPVVVNGVLYIMTESHLFAIAKK